MIEDQLYDDWVPLNKRDKLSFGLILAIASGNLIAGLMYNIIFSLLSPTCTTLGLPPIYEKMILLSGSLIGFFLAPLLGVLSDGLMFKYGRRRIFVVIGTIFACISLLLLSFYNEIGDFFKEGPSFKKSLFILSIILAFVSVNIIQSPARVLCSDVTPPSQQNLMSNICQLYGGFAPIISNLLGGQQVQVKGLNFEQFLLIICISMALVATIVTCIAAREEPLRVKPPKVNPFKQIYLAFKKIPRPFSRVILPFLFSNLAVYQFQVKFTDFMGSDIFVGIYEDEYKNGVSFGMLCLVINNAAQLLYSFVNSKTVDLIGMRWTMVVGTGIMGICEILFIWVRNKYIFFVLAGLIGVSQIIFTSIPYAIVSLVIPTEELGNNLGILNCFCVIGQQISNWALTYFVDAVFRRRQSTMKIACSSFFAGLAMICSLWIVQPSLAETGNYNQIPDESSTAISRLAIDD